MSYTVEVKSETFGPEILGPFRDLAAASAGYCARRDESNEGASTFRPGLVVNGPGTEVYYLSYNGRVWNGRPSDWKPGAVPVYDPSGQCDGGVCVCHERGR